MNPLANLSSIEIYGDAWGKYLETCRAGVAATEPDPQASPPAQSYCAVLEDAVQQGLAHYHLDAKKVVKWYREVSGFDLEMEDAKALSQIVENSLPDSTSNVDVVSAMGNLLHRIEQAAGLGLERHKMAHLFLNYIGARSGYPLIIFRKKEGERYFQAIQDPRSTQALLAEKIRETVIVKGVLYERYVHTAFTDRYRSRDGEELIIQWNEFVEASRERF